MYLGAWEWQEPWPGKQKKLKCHQKEDRWVDVINAECKGSCSRVKFSFSTYFRRHADLAGASITTISRFHNEVRHSSLLRNGHASLLHFLAYAWSLKNKSRRLPTGWRSSPVRNTHLQQFRSHGAFSDSRHHFSQKPPVSSDSVSEIIHSLLRLAAG